MSVSLKRRLVLAACAWVIVMTIAGGLALSWAFRNSVTRTFDENLASELHALVASVETAQDGTWWLSHVPDDPRYEPIYAGRYWQISDSTGQAQRSRSLWDTALPVNEALSPGQARFVPLDGPAGQPLRGVQQRISLPRLQAPLLFQIAQSRQTLDGEIARFDRMMTLSLGLLAAGLVIAIWLQVGYGLQPLRRMAKSLREVREGHRDRLDDDQPAEVQPLVAELESVLAHNRRLVERARSSSADLAHALKTPISVMAAELHTPGDDSKAVLMRELSRTRDLVNRHLNRTAIAGAGTGRRTVVAPVVDDLLSAMRRIHGDRPIEFSASVPTDLVFAGEREDLEELLGNLIDNAGKWAKARVRIDAAAGEGTIQLHIDDDGPGLPPAFHMDAIERGKRFDELTPGSGLGLAIVSDIVESYGGSFRLTTSDLGGLRAELQLPAAEAPR